MLFIAKGRGSGKTTDCIKMAHATGCVLVVSSPARKDDVLEKVRRLSNNNQHYRIDVATADEIFRRRGAGPIRNVIVDDLDAVLQEIFRVNILMTTVDAQAMQLEAIPDRTIWPMIPEYRSK